MCKKWLVVLFLVAGFACAEQNLKKQKSASDLFIQTIQTHYVEPSWVIRFFMNMNLHDFERSWSALTTLIKEKKWYLLCSKQSDYSELACRETIIGHCKAYNTFLQHLYVDPRSGTLIFSFGKKPAVNFMLMTDYWKLKKDRSAAHFYAFYFDALAATFVENVNNAFLNIDNADFNRYKVASYRALGMLGALYGRLIGSSYEARYAHHVKKYHEVFKLLVQEKRKQDELQ